MTYDSVDDLIPIRAVGVEEGETLLVGFGEREDGTGWSLIFQQGPDSLDYDISNENGVTVYGGIAGWTSEGNRLTLELDPVAADALGRPTRFTMLLDVPQHLADLAVMTLTVMEIRGEQRGIRR